MIGCATEPVRELLARGRGGDLAGCVLRQHAHAGEVHEVAGNHQLPGAPVDAPLGVPLKQRRQSLVAAQAGSRAARQVGAHVLDELAAEMNVGESQEVVSRVRQRVLGWRPSGRAPSLSISRPERECTRVASPRRITSRLGNAGSKRRMLRDGTRYDRGVTSARGRYSVSRCQLKGPKAKSPAGALESGSTVKRSHSSGSVLPWTTMRWK